MLLTAQTCKKDNTENCHYRIEFINNSNKTVYIGCTWPIYYEQGFPSPLHQKNRGLVMPHSTNSSGLWSRSCIEYDFTDTQLSTDKILVFVIDKDILKTTDWDVIRQERIFLKEYSLSLADLQALNWKITYSE